MYYYMYMYSIMYCKYYYSNLLIIFFLQALLSKSIRLNSVVYIDVFEQILGTSSEQVLDPFFHLEASAGLGSWNPRCPTMPRYPALIGRPRIR